MKRISIIYGSKTLDGNTATAAKRLQTLLGDQADIFFAREIQDLRQLETTDIFVFLSPTVGDEELQEDFEDLFLRIPDGWPARPAAICELGNYYGYDDFEFGPARILQHFLFQRGMTELVPSLSLDSLPQIPWNLFDDWAQKIRRATSHAN